MHGLACRTSSTYFFRITHAERLNWQSHNIEWRTHQRALYCDIRFNEELLPYWFMVLEERYTTDLEDYRKVTNIIKELANTNNMKSGESRVEEPRNRIPTN